jgi:hypothetical protein
VKIKITTTPTFDREYKRLKKKYKSLPDDLLLFEKDLTENPDIGVDLGGNVHKIRLAIKSKNKGKAGGARIITYTVLASISEMEILLITIFDKSEQDNISDTDIKQIMRNNGF